MNSHPGNRRFRDWVNERKERYTRAPSKGMKFSIAQEVLGLLRAQDPPGRVLRYDSVADEYVEVDAKKALAKTTQALREGAPELRKAKGIVQSPRLCQDTTETKKIMSAGNKKSNGVNGRPTTVHIDLSGKTIAGLKRKQWNDGDGDESTESSGEDDDASSITHNVDDDDKSDNSKSSGLQEVHHEVSYDSSDSKTPKKHDLYYTDLVAAQANKKPKTTPTPTTTTVVSSGDGNSTPPADGKADLLYALAATCADHASSSAVSPPSINKGTDKRPEHSPGDRLVTPDKGSSLKLLTTHPSTDQLAILERIRTGSEIADTNYRSAHLSSAGLTPSENVRLQKERLVQAWLITSMPYLHTDDIRSYTRRLVDDGFDSLPMLTEQLEEGDLDFMKKGHKRALLKVIDSTK